MQIIAGALIAGVDRPGGPNQFRDLNQAVRVMQIITGALLAGVVFFVLVAVLPALIGVGPAPRKPENTPVLTYVAMGFALLQLGVRAVVPGVVARQKLATMQDQLDDSDESRLRLASVYMTQMIIGMALCEGAAFFALIAWMSEGNVFAIGTAGFLMLVMLTAFPTRDRVESWIRQQLELRNFS